MFARQNHKAVWLAALPLLLFSTLAFAQAPDIYLMMKNIQAQMGPLTKFVTAVAYLSGFIFIGKALYSLKSYGDARAMSAPHTDFRGPMVEMIVGTCLIFAPQFIRDLNMTLSGTDSPLQYTSNASPFSEMAVTIVGIVKLVGIVAVIRGLFIFHKLGSGQHQQASFSKGLIHLLGGTLAYNIVWVKDVLFSTLGIG